MKNKKASIMTFVTNALIFAIIIFIIFAIWGSGGGFGLIYKLGQGMAKIPWWVYLGVGVFWLISQMRGK